MKGRITLILSVVVLFFSHSSTAQVGNICSDSQLMQYVSGGFCDTLNNVGYTMDVSQVNFTPNPPICNPTDRDIWFYFITGATPFDTDFTVTGITDGAIPAMEMPRITIVRGSCAALEALACAEAPVGGNSVTLNIPASDFIPNFPYFVIISDWSNTGGSNEGAFEFCIEEFVPPVDNNISQGAVYTACNGNLYDTGGPTGDYAANENITAEICPTDPFQCLTITMNSYSIEAGWDDLTLTGTLAGGGTGGGTACYDPNGNGPAGFFDGVGGGEVLQYEGCVTVSFSSDGIINDSGFDLSWSCSPTSCNTGGTDPVVYPPSTPEGALSLAGCDVTEDNTEFTLAAPTGGIPFDLNNTCWFGTGDEAFYYFSFEAQEDGNFEFIVGNTAANAGQFIDIDFLVWGPLNSDSPEDLCDGVANTAPIRCSYAGGGTDDLTGITNTNPETGNPVTDNDDSDGDDFAPGIAVQEGEVYIILLNDWGGVLGNGLSIDFGNTTPDVFDVDGGIIELTQNDTTTCVGSSVQLGVSGADLGISWSPAGSLSCDDCDNPIASPNTTTTYTAIGEGICGSDTVSVTVFIAELDPIADVQICDGASTILSTSTDVPNPTWSWMPTDGLSCTDCPNPNASPISTTTYTVTMTSGGCILTEDVTVTVNPGAGANFVIAPNQAICEGETVNLGGVADPNATYSWSPDTELSCSNCSDPIVTPSSTETYTLIVTNTISGCESTANVTITVNPAATVPDINGALTICNGEDTDLDAGAGYDSYLWNTGETAQTINVTTSGIYDVLVSTPEGCTAVDTVIVSEGVVAVVITGDSIICENELATLDAGADYDSYLWSTGSINQTISNVPAGTYSVTVTENGCEGTDEIEIIETIVTAQITGAEPTCIGNDITLSAGNGFDSYVWSTGETASEITTDMPGIYSVTVSQNGCEDDATVQIQNLGPNPNIVATGTEICSGEEIVLSLDFGLGDYLWNDGSTSAVRPVTTGGTYSVTVTDASGCTGADTIIITETLVSAEISGNTQFCEGESTNLTVAGTGTFTWFDANNNTVATGENYTTPNLPEGTYTYTVEAVNGSCSISSSTTISVFPTTQVTADDVQICEGESATLIANGTPSGGNYIWTNANGDIVSTNASLETTAGVTETFIVNYELNGCTSSTSVMVNAFSSASGTITANPGTTISSGETVSLEVNGAPAGSTFVWTTDTGETVSGTNPATSSPSVTTIYTVEITTPEGCTSFATITIEVLFQELLIPNVFTPNGDELNDRFFPVYQDPNLNIVEFKVYDRWGELVHDEIVNGWDGTYSGKKMPADIYVYFLRYEQGGVEYFRKGDVALVR